MKKEENDIQYDIVKSEDCGHSIEYKRLAKQFGAPGMPPMGGGAPMAAPAGGPAGAAPMMMNEDKEEECKCKGENKEDCECEKESPKDDLEKNTDQKVRETKGIDHDKERDSDKTKEEKKKIKRPMEKCGDMIAAKKSEKFYIEKIQELRKKAPGIMPESKMNQMSQDRAMNQYKTQNQNPVDTASRFLQSGAKNTGQTGKFGRFTEEVPNSGGKKITHTFNPKTMQEAWNKPAMEAQSRQDTLDFTNRMLGKEQKAPTAPATAPTAPTTKPQEQATATADVAPKYGMKNAFASKGELDKMSFGDAFKEARKTGAGNVFNWRGKKYNTYTRPEMEAMAKKPEENKGNKFFQDWQKRKDLKGAQDAPAAERGYYTRETTPKERGATAETAPTAKETPYEREQRQFENRKFTPKETRQLSAAFPQSEFAMRNRGPGGKLNEARGIDNTTPSFEKLRQFQRNRATGSGDTGGYSMKQLNQMMRRLRQRRQ